MAAMTAELHCHWEPCRDPRCKQQGSDHLIGWGLGAMAGVARGLMLHLGVDPDDHPGQFDDLDQIVGEALLDLGADLLREKGIPTEWQRENGITPRPTAPDAPVLYQVDHAFEAAKRRARIRIIRGYVVRKFGSGWTIYPPDVDQDTIVRTPRTVPYLAGRRDLREVNEWIDAHPLAVTR